MRALVIGTLAGVLAGCPPADDDPGEPDDTGSVDTQAPEDTARDTAPAPDTGEAPDDTGSTPVVSDAVVGASCALTERIGLLTVYGYAGSGLSVGGHVYDKADPWMDAPEETTPSCAFHRFDPSGCGPCETGEVCDVSGACVPARRSLKDLRITVSDGSTTETFPADAQGHAWGMLTTTATTGLSLEGRWGDRIVRLTDVDVPEGDLEGLTVQMAGDWMAPGALDMTWTPPSDPVPGETAFTRIPINHHAAGPTFTTCRVPVTEGSMHATATMVDPLAVITGLEFQGLEHQVVAAATLPEGCVEVRMGRQIFVSPQ